MKVNRPISPILTIKLVAMATSFERSEKERQISNLLSNTYHKIKNLVKIGLVDREIILLKRLLKNRKEVNASRT